MSGAAAAPIVHGDSSRPMTCLRSARTDAGRQVANGGLLSSNRFAPNHRLRFARPGHVACVPSGSESIRPAQDINADNGCVPFAECSLESNRFGQSRVIGAARLWDLLLGLCSVSSECSPPVCSPPYLGKCVAQGTVNGYRIFEAYFFKVCLLCCGRVFLRTKSIENL
jgi:hypothetical protein